MDERHARRVVRRPAPSAPRRGARRGVLLLVLVLVLAPMLAACDAGTGTGSAADDADLAGKTFVSTQVTGHELVDGSEVRLIFQTDRISVQAGCNTLNGGASWDEGALVVTQPMARTMMACAPELMAQDDWLEAFLTSEPALSLDGGTLTLGDTTEGITLDEQ